MWETDRWQMICVFLFPFPFSHNTCITVPCYHFLYRTHVILEKQQCKHTTVCKAVGNCHAALRCGIQCKQPQSFNIPCVLRMPHRSVAWQITRGNCHKRPDGWASPSVMLYNVENQHFTPQNEDDGWNAKKYSLVIMLNIGQPACKRPSFARR